MHRSSMTIRKLRIESSYSPEILTLYILSFTLTIYTKIYFELSLESSFKEQLHFETVDVLCLLLYRITLKIWFANRKWGKKWCTFYFPVLHNYTPHSLPKRWGWAKIGSTKVHALPLVIGHCRQNEVFTIKCYFYQAQDQLEAELALI